MKFTFKNIGPVKRAELTLGKLTIIAGRNNTGKSYIVHTLYGFLIQFRRQHLLMQFLNRIMVRHAMAEKDAFFDMLNPREKDGKIVVMQKDAENLFDLQLREVAKNFSEGLHYAYSATEADFAGAVFSCDDFDFPNDSKGYKPYLSANIASLSLKEGRFEVVPKKNWEIFSEKDFAKQEILLFYMHQFSNMFPTILSAERMSISIFHKELETRTRNIEEQAKKHIYKEGRSLEDLKKLLDYLKITDSYRHPVRDNIDFMSKLGSIQTPYSEVPRAELLNAIEEIVGGHYLYADGKILFFSKSGFEKKEISLHNASSSVQCFALLYFYLRHSLYQGQLFIIDEPETHLDTANQVKLARLLTLCVNAGLQVLITTHSDYLIKEINNLIMLAEGFEQRDYLMENFKYSKEHLLGKEDVKAYVCENGGLTSCEIDKFGIQVPFIDETIDKISKVSDTLSLRLSEEK